MNIADIERILDGEWVIPYSKEKEPIIEHATIYSNDIRSNTLYIAMDHDTWAIGSGNKGSIYDNWTDTHTKIPRYKKNVSALIVQKKIEELSDIPQFATKNTYDALISLSKNQRKNFKGQLIAVTGTVGKSSTQGFLKRLLSTDATVATNDKNNNSRTGIRNGFLNLDDNDYAVSEVAISSLWHGKEGISNEIYPDIAVITQIGVGQAGTSAEKTARLKARLAKYVPTNGKVIVNRDIRNFDLLKSELDQYEKKIITYGNNEDADYTISNLTEGNDGLWKITILQKNTNKSVDLNIANSDEGFISNILCSVAVLSELGKNIETYKEVFQTLKLGGNVLEEIPIEFSTGKYLLVDDTHNAEELSMINAFKYAQRKMEKYSGKKIAVLGRIVNLRGLSEEVHKSLVPFIVEAGFDQVITFGEEAEVIQKFLPLEMRGGHFNSLDRCCKSIIHSVDDDSFILLKGSRRDSKIHLLRNYLIKYTNYYKEELHLFDTALSTDLDYRSSVYSQRGLGNVLTILITLEKLSLRKLFLEEKVKIGINPSKSSNNKHSAVLREGEQYPLKDILAWAVSLDAPDAVLALAEHVFGSNSKALEALKKKSEELNLNSLAVRNITGRKFGQEQRTYLKDLQILGNEFLEIPRSHLSLLRNERVTVPNGSIRMCRSKEDMTGESFASFIWGDNDSHGIVFKLVEGELISSVGINGVNYSNTITGINLAFNNLQNSLLNNVTEINSSSREINILGDTYFGEFYKAREMLEAEGYDHSFKNVKKVFDDKAFNILNFEAVFAEKNDHWMAKYKKFHLFANEEKTLGEFKNLEINLALLANNHANDFGKGNLGKTIKVLNQEGIQTLGADDDIPEVLILTTPDGKRLAILNGYWYQANYDTKYNFYSKGEQLGVNLIPGMMCQQIRLIKENYDDIKVMVIAHWGADFSNDISEQRRISEELVWSGADLIVSSGAHILLPVEKVFDKLIFYGIGNGVFNSVGDTHLKEKMIYGYVMKIDTKSGKLKIYPIYNYNRETYYQPTFVTDEQIGTIVEFNEPENILNRSNLGNDENYYFELSIEDRV